MEIREIEAFLVLAEELHFGRTAQRLGVSPGRVSQLVAALERRLGRQLVLRSSRTAELSDAGERFLADAKTGYLQLERALAATSAAARRNSGVLRLGTSVWLDPAAGAALAEAFEHRHRGRQARCVPVRPADLPGALTGGDIDLLMLPLSGPPASLPFPPGTTVGPVLARHEPVLFVAATHPLARRTAVTPSDMAGHKLLRPYDHVPARRATGYLPAPRSSPSDDPAERAADPHEAFDLILRRRRALLASTSTPPLFRAAGIITIPVSGLPPMHTVLAHRTAPSDQLTTEFLAMATEFGNAASHSSGAAESRWSS